MTSIAGSDTTAPDADEGSAAERLACELLCDGPFRRD